MDPKTILDFITKWKRVELRERQASQEHFLDLCQVLNHPTPAGVDPQGSSFCFEKGVSKQSGGDGWADVWKKGYFGWEYKGKHKNLDEAYKQLLLYREALENPPLLVVCDLDRFVIRTNFTNTPPSTFEFSLESLAEPRNLEILTSVFWDPEKLRPGRTSQVITRDAADRFALIAQSMRSRGLEPETVAKYIDRIVFCLFAEDIGLLPEQAFSRIAEKASSDTGRFTKYLAELFSQMATGGEFNMDQIRHFNGELFTEISVPELTLDEVRLVLEASRLDWAGVDASIFGTLFERGLDPNKRSQLGAHFTGKEEVEPLVNAVVMKPLLREWSESEAIVRNLLLTGRKQPGSPKHLSPSEQSKARKEAQRILNRFLTRLQTIKVLDPACGSGNFLFVTLLKIKDLEKQVLLTQLELGLESFLPLVGPWQMYGFEVNRYAHDLAQTTLLIGWLQWIRVNGFGEPSEPILKPMSDNIRCQDAILDLTTEEPTIPEWPKVDFIVGNPPFLGCRRMRDRLGDAYVDALHKAYKGVPSAAGDLCCYWFERARQHLEKGYVHRVGLLATQGIRGGPSRKTLDHIKSTGDIFWAVSDREWVQDGAMVHVSIVAFDTGVESEKILNGNPVPRINPNLTAGVDVTASRPLRENKNISFRGITPVGEFVVDDLLAQKWSTLCNPNGKPNTDVVVPWVGAPDIKSCPQCRWIIDFPSRLTEVDAGQYEAPFEHVKAANKNTESDDNNTRRYLYADKWWVLARSRPEMRKHLVSLHRYIATIYTSKHRYYQWVDASCLPDNSLIVFARDDDYFMGVIHSRVHSVWSITMGTQLRERTSGFRYTPTSCFETFPFPQPTEAQKAEITYRAASLVQFRQNWLGDYSDKSRTLTKLYNRMPTWLVEAHKHLDEAVCSAYHWPLDITDEEILEKLLQLNLSRSSDR